MKSGPSSGKSEKRAYRSPRRAESARATRAAALSAARALFARHGIDKVTIADIARAANVSAPTIYALFKSKDGLLQEIMQAALFGERFRAAQSVMAGVEDAVELVALTAKVAHAIYASESEELGLVRGASAFSPALKRIEAEFEKMRYEMQGERLEMLFAQGRQKPRLDLDSARRIMWMYTSREIYRMLVAEGGWSGERYEAWLADALLGALVRPDLRPPPST
jgi:AcrR family transcriptional regulator